MTSLHLIALFLLVSVHTLSTQSASVSFLQEAKYDPLINKAVTLKAVARRNSLGPALKAVQRRKRQLSDIVLPVYIDRLSHDIQRYHPPFFRKRTNMPFSGLAGNLKDGALNSYFSERRFNPLPPRRLEEYSEEHFSPSELPEEALGISHPMRRGYFSHNKTNPGTIDGQLYSPSEVDQNLFYQTLQRMGDKDEANDELSFPQDWTKFDKDAYRLYLQSTLNAFNERRGNQDHPLFSSKRNLLRSKRSTSMDSLQELGEENETNVDHREMSNDDSDKNEKNIPIWTKGNGIGRTKRGYDDHLSEKKEKRQLSSNDHDDFLAREYFKQIAQSDTSKKKRFDKNIPSEKRTTGLENLLDNPSILHFAQEKLEEVEEDIMDEVEDEIRGEMDGEKLDEGRARTLLANSLTRLNAIQNMKDSLHQLEILQQQDIVRKRAQDLSDSERKGAELEKEKRRKAMTQLRDDVLSSKKRNYGDNNNLPETKEECPVLDKLVRDCDRVLRMVEDDERDFLELCLLHEVCYMSGSLLGISRHECDATLSSSLELTCAISDPDNDQGNGSVKCRKAAGSTFNALSDPSRYDDEGTIPYDPCVKELLYQPH